MVDALAAALAVQEDLGCLIAHQECGLFLARLAECVETAPSVEWVERADENDVRPAQLRVELALVQHVHVHHRLIVARALRQFVRSRVVCRLHLDVIERALLIFDVDIEPYTLAVAAHVDILLCLREGDLADLDVQDILDQPLAEPLLAHDLLEDEIVRDGQILPGLQRICSIRLVHWHAPS